MRYLKSLVFLLRLLTKENFVNYISKLTKLQYNNDLIYILVNGPSLKKDMDKFGIEEFQNKNCFCVNDFVHDPSFVQIKPKYYALSDPIFFRDTLLKERGTKVLLGLNEKVTWEMYLYVPYSKIKVPGNFISGLLSNPNIKIVPFHSVRYSGDDKLRNIFFKNGWGNGEYNTVLLNAEYVSIQLGFKSIYILGADHTFFDNLHVDEDNRLYSHMAYSYNTEPEIKLLMCHYGGQYKPYTVYSYLVEKTNIFYGHQVMEDFAKYMGSHIINCTTNSLIDSYERYDKEVSR